MKVRVESAHCQGHTLCAMIAPQSFELDDADGHAHASSEAVPADLRGQVHEAIRSCPEQAIVVDRDKPDALHRKGVPL
jgi:ferredoxin